MSLDSQATDVLSAIVGALVYVSGVLAALYGLMRLVVGKQPDPPEDEP